MTKPYLFTSASFLAVGIMVAAFPQKYVSSRWISEEEAKLELSQKTYDISADYLADRIINNDPAYFVIDVRNPVDFKKESIPGSVNIPVDSLFTENWIGYIDQTIKKNVIVAENDSLTEKIWLKARMKGFNNNFTLDGGYSAWKTMLDPKEPDMTEDSEAFALYRQRVGIRAYFTGNNQVIQNKSDFKVVPVQRKKKKMVQGGCS
jgi:rhodanese-related sulfurtransferase